jgi:hypothetical protein
MVSMDVCYHFSAVYGRGLSGGTGYRSSCNHVDSSLQSNRTVVKSVIFMSKPKYRTIFNTEPTFTPDICSGACPYLTGKSK